MRARAMSEGKFMAKLPGGPELALTAVAPKTFVVLGQSGPKHLKIEFTTQNGKMRQAQIVMGEGQEPRKLEKGDPAIVMSAAELKDEYTGTYVSEEVLDAHL